jgi:HK97 family phage major capsid protein
MTATATTAQVENSTGFYRGQSVEVAGQSAIVASVGNGSLTFESAPGAASEGAVVSSKTFAPTPEGMLKPSADIKLDTVTSPVRTIATTIAASVQVLADADSMRQYVDQRLAYAVKLAEEAQILYGNGENPSLQGIMSHPAIQVHTRSSNVSDTKIDAIRRAMTLARVAEYPVSGLVLHPEDLEDLEMVKDADGRYIFISEVSQGGASQIFRVPFVETTAIRPGECLLGAFQMGATVHDRQTASVRVSESHEDYFRRNLVLLRGESRLALSVMRPESFVKVVFD